MNKARKKYAELMNKLRRMGKVVVALSGGVDSALLAKAAREALGEEAQAVTVLTRYLHSREAYEAEEFAQSQKLKHQFIHVAVPEGILSNPRDRCYQCKKVIFQSIVDLFSENDFKVVEGSNLNDKNVYRPGLQALREMGIFSPLLECELTKNEIRLLAKEKGLEVWDKPSNACLLTRFPYDCAITPAELKTVEEAEEFIRNLGFKNVRVRVHGNLSRIEVEQEQAIGFWQGEIAETTVRKLKELGFQFVTLDLEGSRSGCFDA